MPLSNDIEAVSEFKALRNYLKRERRSWRKSKEQRILDFKTINRFYKYVTGKLHSKPSPIRIKCSFGDYVDASTAAGMLNDYFSSVFVKDDGN